MMPPKVSIGMPVYNGETKIRETVNILLAQSFTDFELIISDNSSTDNTELICQEYAKRDGRIRFVRQSSNVGAEENFRYVLKQAQGEFFMWAACDDIRSSDFISVNYEFLCDNDDFVASTSPARFEDGGFDEIRMGDSSLAGERPQRLVKFFAKRNANSRFYSLMRTDIIKECNIINERFLGADVAVTFQLASKGKFNRAKDGWVVIGRGGISSSKNIYKIYRNRKADIFFPFLSLTIFANKLISELKLSDKLKINLTLVRLNVNACLKQVLRLFKRH
jgi:glycosyltransferase involved in cell wall biosynthesis